VNQYASIRSNPPSASDFGDPSVNDDPQAGRLLGRREALALIGASGLALLARPRPARAAVPSANACVARPQQTEGPFFIDESLERSDIRTDPASGAITPGVPLRLTFHVSRLDGTACSALAGATVDVWQCDAQGRYSDVRDWGASTLGQKFLRGYQTTDAAGIAAFTTIYPGWYAGRAVHVHFKIRAPAADGTRREFTSQLYFDDALSDRVFASPLYAPGGARRRMRNDRDFVFRDSGTRLLLDAREEAGGYTGTFDIGLDFSS
jgi:protocatechuate 3,4-dioxygenase beta subunit